VDGFEGNAIQEVSTQGEKSREAPRGSCMGPIFVSYRRDDAGQFARTLYGELASRYGRWRAFMDSETVRAGARWPERIDAALDSCVALIAVVGSQWTSVQRDGRARLQHEDDWVRKEIASALARGRPIFLVLFTQANDSRVAVPKVTDLPADLAALPTIQAVHVRHDHVGADLRPLFEALDGIVWPLQRVLMAFAAVAAAAVTSLVLLLREPAGVVLERDAVGWKLLSEVKPGALLAPERDVERGVVQAEAQTKVFVWNDRGLAPGITLLPIEADEARKIVNGALGEKSAQCGTLLERVAAASRLSSRPEGLVSACERLHADCVPAWVSGPPVVQDLVVNYREACPQ